MPPDPMPDFHHALMHSRGNLDAAELAECHGVLCGLICRNANLSQEEFLVQLASLELLVDPGEVLLELFAEAHSSTLQQLADMNMGFNLWLPDDDQPLDERTDSLAQWCTGMLAGLGLGGELPALSEEAVEALNDLRQIAQAAYPRVTMADGSDDSVLEFDEDAVVGEDEDEEADEVAFMEVVEYVRVVTLMLCEEMRGPTLEDRIH